MPHYSVGTNKCTENYCNRAMFLFNLSFVDEVECFYRAMHFSAERGLAIACRLSVRQSVCNVGGL